MTEKQIREVIQRFFSNTSRPVEETRESLEAIRDDIDMLIESLEGY